jgi:ABC-type polysaccharide/polyol phosphate transport system ATPase subunit
MLPRGTVEAIHVWKRFRADRRRMLLRDELGRLTARLRGRDRGGWRWALRDVDLRIAPGESVGLVGPNGSGKTTLLKILTRVMYPYAGRVDVGGRVGALIEVRAGIHPDLTGRENVFVMGSILGLRRRDVAGRFDDIVGFAELEDAIDRQVKYYSSGMQMRLGFAIAAFLEPDVLLVDEVLAVGDAAFQQRCLDRMRQVLGHGTTLVFVSHDLAAVEAICRRGVWLREGRVAADGEVRAVLNEYRRSVEEAAELDLDGQGPVRVAKAQAVSDGGMPRTQGPLTVEVVLDSAQTWSASVFLGISEGPGTPIFLLRRDVHLPTGESELRCLIPRLPVPRGRFFVWIAVLDRAGRHLFPWRPVARFDVAGPDLDGGLPAVVRLAPVHVEASWELERR